MRITLSIAIVAAGLLLSQGRVLAHHGSAGYSTAERVTVTGTVIEFQFQNPHCIISMNVKDAKGEIQKWQGELTSPNHLVRAGWNAHSIKTGDQITLTGWRATNGSPSLRITKTVVNGQELKTEVGD